MYCRTAIPSPYNVIILLYQYALQFRKCVVQIEHCTVATEEQPLAGIIHAPSLAFKVAHLCNHLFIPI